MEFDDFHMPQGIYTHTVPFTKMINISYGNYFAYIEGLMSLKPGAQFNFLTSREDIHKKYMVIVTDTESPPSLDNLMYPFSPHVYAWAFGTMESTSHRNMAEVWYLGVNKFNTRTVNKSSNSKKMWGPINLKKMKDSKGKTRWVQGGVRLTEKNYIEKNIQGRANPFVTLALYTFCKLAISKKIDIISQPNLPCAHLFHEHYNQETCPGIHLIYTALGFSAGVDSYKLMKPTIEELNKNYQKHLNTLTTHSQFASSA